MKKLNNTNPIKEVKLKSYKTFYYVAKFSSFSIAAKHLGLTQECITKQIQELEKALGNIRLINRKQGNGAISLTPYGVILHESTKQSLKILRKSERLIKLKIRQNKQKLIIGISNTICRSIFTPILKDFIINNPKSHIDIISKSTDDLLIMLKKSRIDIAVITSAINTPVEDVFNEMNFRTLKNIFVVSDKYRFDFKNTLISVKDLKNHDLYLLSKNCSTRKLLNVLLSENNIMLQGKIECDSEEILLSFAISHLGIAYVLEDLAKEYIDKGILYEIKTEESLPLRSIKVCTVNDFEIELISNFLNHLKNYS